ncbi:CBS domain-containing protein [uncultured Clostridium sp.]|jgi:CBS domain-containing protein|uniref:magnesium transporter n=1 Tax=uncultured Clostridium sp. TaxID=59620 RepID=UPI00262CF469|nr:CBS domain-containing protein [uncultured Clostridium sp.]
MNKNKRLTFFLLTSILNNKIYDEYNDIMGTLKDIYVSTNEGYPKVVGYKVKNDQGVIDYEFKSINFYQLENGKINIQIIGSREILPRNYTYLLTVDVLDKKIVDINGKKVVRVDDLRIANIADEYRLIAVETGKAVKYRRMGLEGLGKFLSNIFRTDFSERAIMWEDVQALEASQSNLQIPVSYKRIQELHPADIADILEELDAKERKSVFESLNEDLAADTLEEVEPKFQGSIIRELSDIKTAELFENIPNDEIADILDDLSEEDREKVLVNIEKEDAHEIEGLLAYSDESVGSIMNTDFISLNYAEMSVGETLLLLRETQPEEEVMYTIYLTDISGRLVGHVSFSQLLLNDPIKKLRDVMDDNIITLSYDDKIEEAAELVEKYALLSIPVIDNDEILIGSVLMYDVIDEFFAPMWKRRNK